MKLPQAKKSALCSYGAEDREASSTAFPILFSVPQRLYSQKKATSRQDQLGIKYTGGKNSPDIWFKCPDGMDSWTFFDKLLNEAEVVGTPGAGFGKNGDGWFRLTAFGTHENTVEAMQRVKKLLSK